jgi:hypothetical protein
VSARSPMRLTTTKFAFDRLSTSKPLKPNHPQSASYSQKR